MKRGPHRPLPVAGAALVLGLCLLFPGAALARPEPPRPAPPANALANDAMLRAVKPRGDVHAPVSPSVIGVPRATTSPSVTQITLAHGDQASAPLDRASIRASNGFLNDGAFAKKWSSAMVSPLMFFRSFPTAYYRDVRALAARGVPGGQGIIMGDPHPENFGFIKTAAGTEFAFNDFDDSGRGPVAIDALRYFTALRLAYPDKPNLFAHTLDAYVSAVRDGKTVAPPSSVKPQWSEIRKENLEKFTSENAFVATAKNRLTPAPPKMAAEVRALAAKDARFGSASVLDVAVRERDHGGSGGLQRIWVLAQRKGEEPRILELKEAAPPATDGLAGETLKPAERIATLKEIFLKKPSSDDLFSVDLDGTRFLVRDRSRMSSVALEDLSKDDRNGLFRAQVSVMANVHRSGWAGVDEKVMRSWIEGNSETLADRWKKAFEQAKN